MKNTILVTGGAGFIGSNFILDWIESESASIVNLDKLTYAGNLQNLTSLEGNARHVFMRGDIGDSALINRLLAEHEPRAVLNFAAESHVDRSIHAPGEFIQTNIVGTFNLLESACAYFGSLDEKSKKAFRFLHVSTDEVFGSLGPTGYFDEQTRYDPRSPYSASKAGSDHLVRAAGETYHLPILISNCSNNYGPRQFPEKLIPLMILNALDAKPLPIYGDGMNVRDWIHVEDHADALIGILERGTPGETYCVGARSERTNVHVVKTICAIMDRLHPAGAPHDRLVTYVADRPGHDRRYAIDSTKVEHEIGWAPTRSFEQALEETVAWYLANEGWWRPIREGRYRGERLGLVG